MRRGCGRGNSSHTNNIMEPMSKFCDPLYNIYKISWSALLGTRHHPLPPLSVAVEQQRTASSSTSESGGHGPTASYSSWTTSSNPDTPSSADSERLGGGAGGGPLKWTYHADPFSC